MLRNLTVALTLALLLTGCASVGAKYEPPRTTSPASFTGYAELDDSGIAAPNWWTRFDDPVLAALIEQALVANSDLREAVTRVESARALQSAARHDFLPRGNVSAGTTREQLPGATGIDDRHVEYSAAGINASTASP